MKYIEILSALLTPLIAVVATYIAIQQYRSEKAKARHDLYDRRMAIFKATSKYLAIATTPVITNDSQVKEENEAYKAFVAANTESEFLFDKDVVLYLGLIHMTAAGRFITRLNMNYANEAQTAELKRKLSDSTDEHHKHLQDLRKVFLKYLSLKKLK